MPTWFDKLEKGGKELLKKGKDRAVSSPLAGFIINRTRINRYGKLLNLTLDSFHKQASFSLLLLGEEVPLAVELSYETSVSDAAEYVLVITAASISRTWMDKMVQSYVLNKPLPVPKELYTLLN